MLSTPILQGLAVVSIGVVCSLVGIRAHRSVGAKRWIRVPALGVGGLVLVVGVGLTWWGVAMATGDRSERSLVIAPGADYRRIAIDDPRPQVVHVATIDLDDACLSLDTTRPEADGSVLAETGTEFAARTEAALVVNVAFFYPIEEYPHWDSYPNSGDPITAIGPVVVDRGVHGTTASGWGLGFGLLDGRGWAGPLPAALDQLDFSVPARTAIVAGGEVVAADSEAYPRSVAGVDLDDNELVILVADGKQPGYAEGMTLSEVGELLVDLGVDDAVEFDGGGSSTMVASIEGRVELLSRPSHQRIPGRERPVATHLGVMVEAGCR